MMAKNQKHVQVFSTMNHETTHSHRSKKNASAKEMKLSPKFITREYSTHNVIVLLKIVDLFFFFILMIIVLICH